MRSRLRSAKLPTATRPHCTAIRAGFLQRACACGGTPGPDGECAECRRKRLKRQAAPSDTTLTAPPVVHEVLSSSGKPLDANTRIFMERRFGHDFSQVRVHTDERAGQSAQSVNALAYTVGRDVVFGRGQYAPGTTTGRRLLAHELAHVVQQARSPGPTSMMPAAVTAAGNDPLEREAEGAAARIEASQSAFVSSGRSAPGLQRQADPGQAPQADDCSGWERDPESFSIHVARFVARTQINPILGRNIPSVDCVDPQQCFVTLSNGLQVKVVWSPTNRRTLATWETEQEYKRYLYSYSCPGDQLTLKFVSSHNVGKATPSAPAEGEGT
jgi:hypothetical protein